MGMRRMCLIAGMVGVTLGSLTSEVCVLHAEEMTIVQGTGKKVLTVEQLLQSYEWYSDACAKVQSDLYLAGLEEDDAFAGKTTAENSEEELQALSLRLMEQKEQLGRKRAEYEASYRELTKEGERVSEEAMEQAEALLREIESLEESMALYEEEAISMHDKMVTQRRVALDAELAWKGKSFYTDYRSRIEEGRIEELKYKILANIVSLPLLEKQQELYECQKERIVSEQKVNSVRARFGIADAVASEELSRKKTEIESLLAETESSVECVLNELKEEARLGDASVILLYEEEKNCYDEKIVSSCFHQGSEEYLQLGYYADMYREYEKKLPENEESLKVRATALAANYELQERMLGEQLTLYAKNMLAKYETLQTQFDIAKGRTDACKKRYMAECKKMEYGRTTRLSVLDKKAELLSAEIEYLQCVGEMAKIEFLLDHGVVAEN